MKILVFIPCYNCSKEVVLLIEKLSNTNFKNNYFDFYLLTT